MSYSLKNLPPKGDRPSALVKARWIIALIVLSVSGMIICYLAGVAPGGLAFWIISFGGAFLFWIAALTCRLLILLLQHIAANSWDEQRERWILKETRKSRRALQILSVMSITGHPDADDVSPSLNALMANPAILDTKRDRYGNENVRHSRLPDDDTDIAALIYRIFFRLLQLPGLQQLPANNPVSVLLNCTTSLPESQVRELWMEAWKECEYPHPVSFECGEGLAFVEHWLDTRIQDRNVLLVVSLQVAPEVTTDSGEAASALLLGNRLTQHILSPLALLHRPDSSLPDELEVGIAQASANVPLDKEEVAHLWLAGLKGELYQAALKSTAFFPVEHLGTSDVIHQDNAVGYAGSASSWLALASAAQVAIRTRAPQMVIAASPTEEVLWSTLITPVNDEQESTT
ncbi:hypothetical protein [Citrobacter braakii]|uniref:hypothetical protein n=1 Tax=Citrobacter braakii TaxID=57706 RepID=UPI0011ED262D|nr:hypothetical protein [Citrobacter braakii]